jgi:hypothetical protein
MLSLTKTPTKSDILDWKQVHGEKQAMLRYSLKRIGPRTSSHVIKINVTNCHVAVPNIVVDIVSFTETIT